jgi:hypothetical protein
MESGRADCRFGVDQSLIKIARPCEACSRGFDPARATTGSPYSKQSEQTIIGPMGSHQTLTGEMERSRPRTQRVALACLFGLPLVLIAISAARQLIWHIDGRREAPLPLIILMAALLVGGLATNLRSLGRNITEFSYDGSALRFRTSARRDMKVRSIDEIDEINPWYGRGSGLGQMLGYRLTFRDQQEVRLELRVSNAEALAERLQADRWPERQPTL